MTFRQTVADEQELRFPSTVQRQRLTVTDWWPRLWLWAECHQLQQIMDGYFEYILNLQKEPQLVAPGSAGKAWKSREVKKLSALSTASANPGSDGSSVSATSFRMCAKDYRFLFLFSCAHDIFKGIPFGPVKGANVKYAVLHFQVHLGTSFVPDYLPAWKQKPCTVFQQFCVVIQSLHSAAPVTDMTFFSSEE